MSPRRSLFRGASRLPTSPSAPAAIQFWAMEPEQVFEHLRAKKGGLSSQEADSRLQQHGPNALKERRRLTRIAIIAHQLRSPLLFLLVFAAAVAGITGEWIDAAIVMTILVASIGISTHREYDAQSAADALRSRIRTRATVLRDGKEQTIPAEHVVPGEIVLLSAGSLVPADALILEAADC